jgi:hypothetical protein
VKKKPEESKLPSEAPLRVLTLSREGLSFHKLVDGPNPGEVRLEEEQQFPKYPTA